MALAQAVLQNPRMLILDEATSALDATAAPSVTSTCLKPSAGEPCSSSLTTPTVRPPI